MDKLTAKALNAMIDEIIAEHQEEITESILANTNENMTTEQIVSVMVANSLSLSMKLSVQLILDLLQSQGILQIDDREVAKLFLKHLSSEKDEN